MTEENKALVGKKCIVEFEGKEHHGTIISVLESIMNTKIILHTIKLDDGTVIGKSKLVKVIGDEDV